MPTSPDLITVVDDDAETVAMLVAFFELLGLLVAPCPVDLDAAAWILEHRPSLIILDVLLHGGLTGVDVFHQVRADPTMQTVPVIVFSGSERQLRQLLPDYPTQGVHFVEKPDIAQLSALVQRLLQPPAA
jgi:CheY-like chemotaxis protein